MSSSCKGKRRRVIRRVATVGWTVATNKRTMNEEARQTVALMESTIISLRAQLEAMTSEKQEMRLQMQNMQEQFQQQVTQLQEQSRQQMEQLQLQNTRLMDKMSELVQKTSCNKKEQKVAKRTRTSNRFEALNVEGEEPLTTSDDQKMAPKKKTKNCPNSEEPEPELEQEEEEDVRSQE